MSKTTRLLSLILVIVMALSLFAVSGNAAWADDASKLSDYASVNYKEAAKVLSYLNIINGIDGAFKPEGNLQRDQAAKIVTLLVTAADDKLADTANVTQTTTAFSDVAKDHWASGYIQWAYNNNIVNGKGDGSYHPTESVTVLQFLKMLLTGLGYGANGEFVGTGWDTTVYVKATEMELWGDVAPVIADRVATREEAMEFSLQALKKVPVHYGFNAYAQGSLLNVNSYDTRPLYLRHKIDLVSGTDPIGYLTYQWVDASNNALIYEGMSKWQKQTVLKNGVKVTDLTSFINSTVSDVASSVTNVPQLTTYINGLDVSNPETLAQFKADFATYAPALNGAKVTQYVNDRVLYRVVIEIEHYAYVKQTYTTTKTYDVVIPSGGTTAKFIDATKTWENVSADVTYTKIDNVNDYAKDTKLVVVPLYKVSSAKAGFEIETIANKKALLKIGTATKAGAYSGYTSLANLDWKVDNKTVPANITWYETASYSKLMSGGAGGTVQTAGSFWYDSNGSLIYYAADAVVYPTNYAIANFKMHEGKGAEGDGDTLWDTTIAFGMATNKYLGSFDLRKYPNGSILTNTSELAIGMFESEVRPTAYPDSRERLVANLTDVWNVVSLPGSAYMNNAYNWDLGATDWTIINTYANAGTYVEGHYTVSGKSTAFRYNFGSSVVLFTYDSIIRNEYYQGIGYVNGKFENINSTANLARIDGLKGTGADATFLMQTNASGNLEIGAILLCNNKSTGRIDGLGTITYSGLNPKETYAVPGAKYSGYSVVSDAVVTEIATGNVLYPMDSYGFGFVPVYEVTKTKSEVFQKHYDGLDNDYDIRYFDLSFEALAGYEFNKDLINDEIDAATVGMAINDWMTAEDYDSWVYGLSLTPAQVIDGIHTGDGTTTFDYLVTFNANLGTFRVYYGADPVAPPAPEVDLLELSGPNAYVANANGKYSWEDDDLVLTATGIYKGAKDFETVNVTDANGWDEFKYNSTTKEWTYTGNTEATLKLPNGFKAELTSMTIYKTQLDMSGTGKTWTVDQIREALFVAVDGKADGYLASEHPDSHDHYRHDDVNGVLDKDEFVVWAAGGNKFDVYLMLNR